MLKIFEPPQGVEAEDMKMMCLAISLSEKFTGAAMAHADKKTLHPKIMDTMGLEVRRRITDISTRVYAMGDITNQREFAETSMLGCFLNDIFFAAAVDHMPKSVIIGDYPREYATEEWADLFERYDMYTTAGLIRDCMRAP